jgi:hypothetical protein
VQYNLLARGEIYVKQPFIHHHSTCNEFTITAINKIWGENHKFVQISGKQ